MKHISFAFLLLACTYQMAQSQELSIGTPAANPLVGDVVADDSNAVTQEDSVKESVDDATSDQVGYGSANSIVTLERLHWLVGDWADDNDDGRVEFQFELIGDGGFLKNAFSSTDREGNVVLSGVQIIGIDPGTQTLRSWTFDSLGGRGEADWTHVHGRWLSRSSFTLGDGSTGSAINVYTKVDEDSFEWKSVSREVDGELQPALPPSIVRRVAASPDSFKNGMPQPSSARSEQDLPQAERSCVICQPTFSVCQPGGQARLEGANCRGHRIIRLFQPR